ncbi:hypothetical protein J2S49_000260 [Arcanobacterium wilhelmae]|uniref:Uncharacterized protein n=1 Tax=Arcanobacterium wilhelmae TaxID=1803177 RepID=A0ABT9N8Z7_9ACTO|nr:hypothetical protein [Arcanobacterium wilhelmae]MDP9800184.1 hypothetical protein [Arcanobacterium wilhelmae]WFN89625.1 hypothetical protein P8A24_05295 [Arcanobacterium wilhelmae]
MNKAPGSPQLTDTRTRSWGWPIALMILLAVASTIFAWRAVLAATAQFVAGDVGGAVTTLLAAIAWVLGTAGLIHNGRKMRRIAWVSWSLNVLGSLIGVVAPAAFSAVNPWQMAGKEYFFLPAIGTIFALGWLAWSDPARVAARGN